MPLRIPLSLTLLLLLPLHMLARPQGGSLPEPKDTVASSPADSVEMSDTLRTLVVSDDGRLPIGVSDAAREHISTKSLGDVLGGKVMDKIMHPFAIKQRKRERHARKMARILREYEMVRSDRDALLEALRREGIDPDSLISVHSTLSPTPSPGGGIEGEGTSP